MAFSTSINQLDNNPDAVNLLEGISHTTNYELTDFDFLNNKNIYFTNNKHTFKAHINKLENGYGYTIKIGGEKYFDCINISIMPDENGKLSIGHIGHIQAEKECSFSSFLDNNETVQFVKAALTFVKMKFPDVQRFEFTDMSKIDCGISKKLTPPRTHEKPFSLPHFSIAKYGKTWYEDKFDAKMISEESYQTYKKWTTKLFEPIQMPFEKFVKKAQMTPKQADAIRPFFENADSWVSLFRSIPKKKQCDILYNWLERFIKEFIGHSFHSDSWYIDATTMDNVPVVITKNMQVGGVRKTRRNRKIRGTRMYHAETSSMNFGGGYMGE